MQSCGGKASKVLLLLVNVFIFLLGGGFVGLGVYYHVDGGLYQNVLNEAGFITVPVVLMFLGSVFLVIAFLAIVGALCEVVIILKIYLGVVAFILFLEVILVCVVIAMRGEVEKQTIEVIQELMEHYGNETSDELNVITKVIDETQQWLKCCGLVSPDDWRTGGKAKWWEQEHPDTVPKSCCKPEFVNEASCNDAGEFYEVGCRDKLYTWVESNVTYVTVIGLILLVFQCFILICGLKIRFELASDDEFGNVGNFNMETTTL